MKQLPQISSICSTPRRKLCLAIAAQMMLSAGVKAAPIGGTIVGGDGSIDHAGLNTTIIQNSDRLAVDWESFNIAAEERVQFIQPDSSSVALNRILGNEASQIFGRLDANGHVILMNPNGVLFGENATVNVGGLVASGLSINANDFMNGDFVLRAIDGTEGTVINRGIINAATGGNVALIGRQVDNQGLISAKLGSVNLAAGKEAVLTFDNEGLLGVRVSQEILQSELGVEAAVSNSGDITAEGGRILLTGSVSQDIFSQAVNSDGLNAKTSVVMHEDGSFTLGAGADVVNAGTLSTSSNTSDAGQIVVLGENINNSGAIRANNKSANAAGNIEIHSRDTTLVTEQSQISATNDGAGSGGQIKILGDRVGVLDQSHINASGTNGGGDINIGGGFQGKETQLRNATRTVVGKDALIEANAITEGDGGDVIVWADQTTSFTGEINARGGELGGDGGFVEVSGKDNLRFLGSVDRTAVKGKNGTLLLDPEHIRIVASGLGNSDDNSNLADQSILFDDLAEIDLTIGSEALLQSLLGGNTILEAVRNIVFADGSEVDVIAADASNNSSLMLNAGGSIQMEHNSYLKVGGDVIFNAGTAACGTVDCATVDAGEILIAVGGFGGQTAGDPQGGIFANGDVVLRAADDIRSLGDLTGRRVEIRAGSAVTLSQFVGNSSSISAMDGNLEIFSGDASIQNAASESVPSGQFEFTLPALRPSVSPQTGITLNGTTSSLNINVQNGNLIMSALGGVSGYDPTISISNGEVFLQSELADIVLPFLSISSLSEDDSALQLNLKTAANIHFGVEAETIIDINLEADSDKDGLGSINLHQSISTFGGNLTASAESFMFGSAATINTKNDSSELESGDIRLMSQEDISLSTIVAGGDLYVESVQGSVTFLESLAVAGGTNVTASQDITLSGDLLLEPGGDVFFNAGRTIEVKSSSAPADPEDPRYSIKLASDNTASFFWNAGSGIKIFELELGLGDFVANANNGMQFESFHTGGKVLLRSIGAINWNLNSFADADHNPMDSLEIYTDEQVFLPANFSTEGDVRIHSYSGAANLLANEAFQSSDGRLVQLPELASSNVLRYDGRVDWWSSGVNHMLTRGGDFYIKANIIDHFGGTVIDTSSISGHGEITLIARDHIQAPPIRYSNAVTAPQANAKITIQAGQVLLDRDFDFNNAGVVDLSIVSNGDVILGVVRGDQHDLSTGQILFPTEPDGGRIFDSVGGDDDKVNITITTGGTVFQKYDVFTGGGNYTATALDFVFNNGVQINSDFSNIDANSLTGAGNISLIETGTDFPISSRLVLPNIRTQGECLDLAECGDLNITTDRVVSHQPFEGGDAGINIKVFGDASFNVGGIDLRDEINNIQFDGLVSVEAGYVSLLTKGGFTLGDWFVTGTAEVVAEDLQGRSSDLISNSSFNILWAAVFGTNGDLILQGANTRFQSRAQLHARRVLLDHDGDLRLETLFLSGGTDGEESIINVNGSVISDPTSASFVESGSGRAFRADIIGASVDGFFQEASPVVFNVTGDLLLSSPDSRISSVEVINAQNVQLTNSTDMNIAGINAQNLFLEASGNITQSDAITVAGTTTINASSAANIDLDNPANDFNLLSVESTGASVINITDSGTITLSNIDLNGAGQGAELSVIAASITQAENTSIHLQDGAQLNLIGDFLTLGANGTSTVDIAGAVLNGVFANDLNIQGVIRGAAGVADSQLAGFYINGSAADNFVEIAAGASITGEFREGSSIAMGAGDDIANIAGDVAISIEGGAGQDTFTIAPNISVAQIIGGEDLDTLVGADVESEWVMGVDPDTDINRIIMQDKTILFAGIESLIGGSLADTFIVNGIPSASGISNDLQTNGVLRVSGGGGDDMLNVRVASVWDVGIAGGSVASTADESSGLIFDSFEFLRMDSGRFKLQNLNVPIKSFIGDRSGSALDLSSISGEVVFDLEIPGFELNGINILIGNGAASTVRGFNIDGGWILGSYDASSSEGAVNGWTDFSTAWYAGSGAFDRHSNNEIADIYFFNFGRVQGGAGVDEFHITRLSHPISPVIDGGSGENSIHVQIADAAGYAWTIDAVNQGTFNGSVSFENIQNLFGSAGGDTFTFSPDSGIGSITAGIGDDTFILANNITAGILDGGEGNDVLDRGSLNFKVTYLDEILEGDAVYTAVNIENPTSTGGTTTLVGVDGYNAQWTITGDGSLSVTATGSDGVAVTNQFNNVTRVEGGSGTDEFILSEGGALAEGIFGNGNDSLQASNTSNNWRIDSENGGVLTVDESTTLLFQGIANLIGGSGSDIFNIATGGSITGSISGGAGADTLTISDASVTNNWQLGESNSVGSVAFFTEIETLIGNANNDIFNFTGATDVIAIQGGDGNNSVTWQAGDLVVDLGSNQLNAINFTDINSVTADAASNATLIGADTENLWTLTAIDSGSVNDFTFSGFNKLQGGSDNDVLQATNGENRWTNVDATTNALNDALLFNGMEQLIGGADADEFAAELVGVTAIDGGLGTNQLAASDSANNEWSIDGDNSGSFNTTLVFERIQNLVGGAGNDTFTFSANSSIGNINAGAGDDTFVLANNITAGSLDGGVGFDTLDRGSLNFKVTYLDEILEGDAVYTAANIENPTSTGGSTTLVGVDGYNAQWTITGDGSLSVTATGSDGVAVTNQFNNVTRVEGGSGTDEFILSEGGALAEGIFGNGNDSLQASNTSNNWRIDSENGGALTVDDGTTLLFQGIANLIGGSGSDIFNIATGGSITGSISGGAGADTLTISDASVTNNWQLGESNSVGSVAFFTEIETLIGNANNDIFNFTGATDVIAIQGGAGNNSVTWQAGDLVVDLGSNQLNAINFTDINSVTADAANNATLIGADTENLWTLTGIDSGSVNDFTFSGFNKLQGGSDNDVLQATDGDNRWINIDATTNALNDALLFNGMEQLIGGADADEFAAELVGVTAIDGGLGTNQLAASDSANNEWSIDGDNSGSFNTTLVFERIQNLVGGAGNDTFTFSANSSIGNINAGAGDDTFVLANNITAGSLDGGAGIDTLDRGSLNFIVTYLNEILEGDAVYTAANIENPTSTGGSTTLVGVDGYNAQWTITGDGSLSVTATGSDGVAVTNQFNNVTRVEGGSGADEFILSEGGALAEGIFGNGDDSLQASNTSNNWRIDSENGGVLTVDDGTTLLFQGIANLIGGSGSDIFNIATGGSITGSINGGAGADSLVISDASVANQWQLGAANSVAQVARFQGIETLTGNSGDDTFAFTGASDVTAIEGGAGNNTLLWSAGDLAVNLGTGLLNEEILFSGISAFDADATANNTLTGADAVNSWSIDGDAAGTVSNANGSVAFSGFQTLIGGAEADTFTLAAGVNLSEIYGGAGNDVFVIGEGVVADNFYGEAGDDSFDVEVGLVLSGVLDGGTGGEVEGDYIDLSKHTLLDATADLETALGFAFRNFERIDNPNNRGVYFGGNGTNFWYITGANQGRLEIRDGENAGVYEFSGVHSLRGGTGEDIFIFANDSAAITTLIDGGEGAGANTLDLSAQGLINQWLLDGANSGRVSNSSNAGGNIFTNIAYLIGGSAADRFELHAGGSIAGAIDGGLGNNELVVVAVEQTTNWRLGEANGHSVTGVASFSNIAGLIGGVGNDIFDIYAELTDISRINGGEGSDAVNFRYDAPISVDLARGLAAGLLVEGIERFTSLNALSTLIGVDDESSWTVDGANAGSVRYLLATGEDAVNVAFDGFGNLVAGAGDDRFVFTQGGALSGTLGGGAGRNAVDLQSLANDVHVATAADVALPPGVAGLNLANMDELIGNGRTWLYGASDRSYTWTIDGARSGRVTSTLVDDDNRLLAFENLSAIRGGANDDIFQVTVATPLLSLDGGGAVTADLVDYSQVNGNLRINVAEALSGQNGVITGIEGIRGNNAGPDSLHTAELIGPDGGAIWRIGNFGGLADGVNDGEVAFGDQTISFLDFNLLTGGAGNDTFNQTSGVVLGVLNGGAGNDTFNIDLAGANAGTRVIGGAGTDSLLLRGGEAEGVMTYTAAASGGEFDYGFAGEHYKVSHQDVENLLDQSLAETQEIRGSSLAETFALGNGRFQVNGADAIEYRNKRDIAVRTGINDIIDIAENLQVAGTLTLANGTVTANDPANASITAPRLVLDSVRDVGLASARLRTSVDDLLVLNSVGDIYLQEQNGLNLAEFNANGVFDLLLLNGDLVNSAPLYSADVFRVTANNGDITLTGANQLRDDVALTGQRVELHNATTLTLVEVNAEELILRTQRGIEGDGPVVVSGLTSIDAQGDVIFDFATNDFNKVRVTNAVNLTLVDQNAIELLDINASGAVVIRSTNNLTLNDQVSGGNGVSVSSGNGSINQNGTITTNNGAVVVSAGNGEVNMGDEALIVANGGSVNINAGAGDVNMGGGTRITANGGDVNIVAADNVVVAEVVSSGTVVLNAGTGSVTDGNGGATNITAGGLQSSSNSGFGSNDAIETEVGNIDISTNTGNVAVNNTGAVTVEGVRTGQGDISIVNQGDLQLGGNSISAQDGANGGSVDISVSQGSVTQSGSTQIPAVKGTGTVVISAPDGAIGGGGGLRVDAPIVEIIAAIKAGEIFVNPGADKIEYFSGSFKFDDQLLAIAPLEDINPAIFANVRSYFFNDISLLLPRDQRYDDDEREDEE